VHVIAQPYRHTTSETFQALKGCATYTTVFETFEVRENEIALRKLSGATAHLRTLEGTLRMGTKIF